ncbi:MAG: LysR family transcriptional regulator [Bifidobacteriaceae bacterium]|jgi:DNA-binding transcriptional LysR family regulator|nr:LysR family transcriptional regulator [Bifidobacteriaceae bacterium]
MLPQNLGYFLKVCQAGSITKAADDLYLSRQALSESIKHLEAAVGVPLFVRSKGGVSLTAAGKAVRRYANRADRLWRQTLKQVEHGIRVGTDLTHTPESIIMRLRDYEARNPEVALDLIHYDDHRRLAADLLTGDPDLAVALNVPHARGVSRMVAFTARVHCLMGKDNPLAGRTRIDFHKDLAGQRVLVLSRDVAHALAPYEKAAGFKIKLIPSHTSGVKELLLREDSLLLIPAHSLPAMLTDAMVAPEGMSFPTDHNVYVAYLTANRPKVEALADYLREAFGGLRQELPG